MIRFTCILVAGLLAANISNAQSPQEIKGPKAKNYKPWKQEAQTSALMVNVGETPPKGPAFKNKKSWKNQADKVQVSSESKNKEQLTGPKAKNRKIWEKNGRHKGN